MPSMHSRHPFGLALTLALLGTASCADASRDDGQSSEGTGASGSEGEATGGSAGSSTSSGPGDGGSSTTGTSASSGDDDGGNDGGGVRLDVGGSSSGSGSEGGSGGEGSCKVDDGGDGSVGECRDRAPADSFAPEVQWSWTRAGAITTPLVANLTDDNGDGAIDLCDIPDVLVVDGTISAGQSGSGSIVVLAGDTGELQYEMQAGVEWTLTPALGDIDGDGLVEIVSGGGGLGATNLVAFEHDGTVKWISAQPWDFIQALHSAIALADLDADGDVEILAGNHVFDHLGNRLWIAATPLSTINATTAADLDRDGDLEVVIGKAAYHHDGTLAWDSAMISAGTYGMFPQVANFDEDDDPEILVAAGNGLFLLEHDGTFKASAMVVGQGSAGGLYPATVHDFDGDSLSDFAVSAGTKYTAYRRDTSIIWSADVVDASGVAAGTAFDFLGDGVAEAMYADEHTMWVFDGRTGAVAMQAPRSSGTSIEYPTVADIDNDGSSEILVVSHGGPEPTIQALRDRDDRWIQARRIMNQHTYHVTNVREDGTIPRVEPFHWLELNTFRTNAQIEGGGVCRPPVG